MEQFELAKTLYLRLGKLPGTAVQNKLVSEGLNNAAWLTVLIKDGNAEEALKLANDALKIQPDFAEFLDTRGMIYLKIGDLKRALDDLSRTVTLDPSSPYKLFHLAQAQLTSNDKEKARQSWEKARFKGFTPKGLHALEQEKYQHVVSQLESH